MTPIEFNEILGVLVKTLTTNDKYRVLDCEKLPLPIQMQLSEKRKGFSQSFAPFLESTSNFKHLKENMIVIANLFPKLQTVKDFVRRLSKKPRFRTRFNSQYVQVSQILAKSL